MKLQSALPSLRSDSTASKTASTERNEAHCRRKANRCRDCGCYCGFRCGGLGDSVPRDDLRKRCWAMMGAGRVLGIQTGAPKEQVEAAYRKAAARLHPDRGGDPESFKKATQVRAALLAVAGAPKITFADPPSPPSRVRPLVRRVIAFAFSVLLSALAIAFALACWLHV